MDVFVYSHTLGNVARGLTNQVVAMLHHLILLEEKHVKRSSTDAVVFLDHFYSQYDNDASQSSYSSILDLEYLNRLFFRRLHLVDLHRIPTGSTLKLVASQTDVHVPINMLRALVVNQSSVYQNSPHIVDPEVGVEKVFELSIPNGRNPVRMREYGGRLVTTHWSTLHSYTRTPFLDMSGQRISNVLRNLRFSSCITSSVRMNMSDGNSPIQKYSLVHLRNERDAIQWWCKGNHMTPDQFEKELNKKYIDMITTFIPRSDILVVLTSEPRENRVLSELVRSGYRVCTHPSKRFGVREVNAVEDMWMAENKCNSVLICPTGGSTFSHWLAIRLEGKYERLVEFNISNIRAP